MNIGLDSLKFVSKEVVHKAGQFLGNKIADAVTKSNGHRFVKQEPLEEIIIPPKEGSNIKQIKISIVLKMEHYKITKLLNDSTVSKFVKKNGSK